MRRVAAGQVHTKIQFAEGHTNWIDGETVLLFFNRDVKHTFCWRGHISKTTSILVSSITHNFITRYSVIKPVLVGIPYSTCYVTLSYKVLLHVTVTVSPLTDGLCIPFTQTRKRGSPAISGWEAVTKRLDNSCYLWQEPYGNTTNRNYITVRRIPFYLMLIGTPLVPISFALKNHVPVSRQRSVRQLGVWVWVAFFFLLLFHFLYRYVIILIWIISLQQY
jgi:hypothetical protein